MSSHFSWMAIPLLKLIGVDGSWKRKNLEFLATLRFGFTMLCSSTIILASLDPFIGRLSPDAVGWLLKSGSGKCRWS